MAHQYFHRRRVEFAETDAAGIMHFSEFFRYMESAEHAFYRSLGLSVHPFHREDDLPDQAPLVGWPRVHASADYRAPLRFEEEVEIELLVERIANKTIHFFFRFWKHPDELDRRSVAATGRLTVICVSFVTDSSHMKAVAIPDEVREKIHSAPTGSIPEAIARQP